MTEPVGFNASLNYTPYDAGHDLCQAEGTGGARGAEGAGGTPNSPPAPEYTQNCTSELLKVVATCGSAVLAARALPPSGLLGGLGCLAVLAEAVECLAEPETKAAGQ
jgi:hypothetical protein